MIDIPTAVTPAEVRRLRELARGKRVLEIGSLLGHSTVALAQVAEAVVSVDPHEGYPFDNPRPTITPFIDNLVRYGVRDKVTVCVGTDADVLPFLTPHQFHLAFIDATGEYDVTLAAMRRCVPLLTHHAALAVHDCGHPDWPGALDAVADFACEKGTRFELVDRLGVFIQTWG